MNDIIASTCVTITESISITSLGISKESFDFTAENTSYVQDNNNTTACKGNHWHAIYKGTETVTYQGMTFIPGYWYDFCDLTDSSTTPTLSSFTGNICLCEAPGVNGNPSSGNGGNNNGNSGNNNGHN